VANAELFRKLVVQIRKRPDCFCGHPPALNQDAKFAALRSNNFTLDKQVISQVN
jgi:hypothetical protein